MARGLEFKRILLLLRLYYINSFRVPKDKAKTIVTYIVAVFSFLTISCSIALTIYFITPHFVDMGMGAEFVAFIAGINAVALTLLGASSALTFLYFNADTEFVLRLPIKTRTVFLSRFIYIYFGELLVSLMFSLPMLIALAAGGRFGALFYVSILFFVLIIPLIPLLVVAVLSLPLMSLVRYFKNRALGSSIVRIIILAVFFGLLLFMSFSVQSMTINGDGTIDIAAIASDLVPTVEAFKYIFYPFYMAADFALMNQIGQLSLAHSLIINAFATIGFVALFLIMAVFLSSLHYKKGITAQLECQGVTKQSKSNSFTQRSVPVSLIKRELFDIIRNPTMGMQCFAGALVCPMITLFMMLSMNMVAQDTVEMADMSAGMSMMIIAMLGAGLNPGASSCISREGKNFYILRLLPVPFSQILRYKKWLFVGISWCAVLISLIIVAALGAWIDALMGLPFCLLYSYGYVCFAMNFDVREPNLTWTNPLEVTKQGKNQIVPYLVSTLLCSVLMIPILVAAAFNNLPLKIVVWLFVWGITFFFAFMSHRWLYSGIEQKLRRIEP